MTLLYYRLLGVVRLHTVKLLVNEPTAQNTVEHLSCGLFCGAKWSAKV